jgi:hypothetical protein
MEVNQPATCSSKVGGEIPFGGDVQGGRLENPQAEILPILLYGSPIQFGHEKPLI